MHLVTTYFYDNNISLSAVKKIKNIDDDSDIVRYYEWLKKKHDPFESNFVNLINVDKNQYVFCFTYRSDNIKYKKGCRIGSYLSKDLKNFSYFHNFVGYAPSITKNNVNILNKKEIKKFFDKLEDSDILFLYKYIARNIDM